MFLDEFRAKIRSFIFASYTGSVQNREIISCLTKRKFSLKFYRRLLRTMAEEIEVQNQEETAGIDEEQATKVNEEQLEEHIQYNTNLLIQK